MRQKRMEQIALILAIFLGLWTVYFAYDVIGGLLRVRFGDPAALPDFYDADPEQLTIAIRNTIFLAWLPTGIFGTLGFFCGFMGAFNVYRGRLFDPTALWPVTGIGICTCLSIATQSLAYNYELRQMWPLTDRDPLTHLWYWNQGDVTMFCFGVGFILIGLIHIEAAKIMQENKEFI